MSQGRGLPGCDAVRGEYDYRLSRIEQRLAEIIHLLRTLQTKEARLSTILDALTAEVAQTVTVDESVLALVDNIAAQLKAAGPNQAAIQQVIDTLAAERTKIAAAVSANTPAAPVTTPAPDGAPPAPDHSTAGSGDPGAGSELPPPQKVADPAVPGSN